MLLESIQYCCNLTLAALDGVYGWYSEAIAILIFVLIFNFLAKWILRRLHHRYERQKKIWKDSFVRALYLPLSYYVWFFAIVHAIELIAENVEEGITIKSMHTVLAAGAVIAFAWFLMRWKNNIVQYMISRSKNREITVDPGKIDAIDKIVTVAIFFFVILILLEVTDRSVNTLIAFSGVGGLALAFASQEIISNFFGGFMIYLTQPFAIGDWIHLPEKNIEGTVEEIGWYMTRIRSLDKRPIYIPNSIFSKIVVITPSRMSHRQIKETIGIRPEDLPKLKTIISEIRDMLQQNPEIDRNQQILVNLSTFGQSSIDITISAYTIATDTASFMRVKEDILYKITNILSKNDAQLASLASPTHQITLINKNA